MSGTVLFLSSMCLLDNASGAALSVRAFLTALAGAGFRCLSFTASLFDPPYEVPLAPVLGPEAVPETAKGKLLVLRDADITHHIFLTRSTQGRNLSAEEQHRMPALFARHLADLAPDLVISYGSSGLVRHLRAMVRERGMPVAIYLGNAEYTDAGVFDPADRILVPSHFLKRHYEALWSRPVDVVRTIMEPDRLLPPEAPGIAARPAAHRLGFVTFINPIPHKGLLLFARLARMAGKVRPDITFLVVEGRMPRSLLASRCLDLATWPNVWWLPTQDDVRTVWRRTSILLVPSFWQEGFPRSVLEAQLSGIPVIASSRGGIPEALNGGSVALDIPESWTPQLEGVPDAVATQPWLDALLGLWDDEAAYRAAAARALEAAAPFHPEVTAPAAIDFFRSLMTAAGR
ncbi:MAG: glycosyltransferase [Gammaproteobacteria bacterium]|jgi:glycosyltransferase involved in cell wall biosynthesis|nr:glycosyltransferase [Gammaproteobacteria bacterium]